MAHQAKNPKNTGSLNRGEEMNGSVGSSSSPQGTPSTTSLIPNNNAPKYGTVVPNRIFVGGISPTTTELDLTQLFSSAYGRVTATKIILDRAGVSKGYGFVTFETEEEAKRVLNDTENIVLKERRLNIAPAVKKQGFSRAVENGTVVVAQPAQVYQNGVSYSYHNGMAFFNGTHPQQPIDPTIYQSYTTAPQVTQFTPVLYSAQMYFQGPPQQYPTAQYQIPIDYGNCDVCTQYPSAVGDAVFDGTDVFSGPSVGTPGGGAAGGSGYPSEVTTAPPACFPASLPAAYPAFHEYRRVLTIPPPPHSTAHFYEPHYIEPGEEGKESLSGEATCEKMPATPVVSLAKLKDDSIRGGWNIGGKRHLGFGKRGAPAGVNHNAINNNNNPSATNRNLNPHPHKSPPPVPYSPIVRGIPPTFTTSPSAPPRILSNTNSRIHPQVPQYPFYQGAAAVLPYQAPPPAPQPHPHSHHSSPMTPAPPTQSAAVQTNHRRPSANHQQRRNTNGRRGRGSRSGSSGGGGGEPLTPPTTPGSSPPPQPPSHHHHNPQSATPMQQMTSSIQALTI